MKPEKVVIPLHKIHETAIIHPAARIGNNVEIGPYTVIGENVLIGDGTKIGAYVNIEDWTRIGKDCIIFPYASIGAIPQDLKFSGEKSYVFIGNCTQIREFVTIHRATGEGEETRIGSHCLLQTYTHVAHNCIVGNHVILSSGATLGGHVVVEDHANIGGLAGVHQFVKIGYNAMIGGASKVTQDVPPFIIADGHPAKAVGTNDVGMSRNNISIEVRRIIKKAYRMLYRSNLNLAQAIALMEQELDAHEELEYFLRFLRNAERGICRSRKEVTQ